jgi:hypothetical protein
MIQGGLIRRKGTGVSPRTLNICLTVLRNVLRGVLQEGWIKCCKTYAVGDSKQLWFGNWIAWDDH